jgi:4'-phosphopantetheinyl transferase
MYDSTSSILLAIAIASDWSFATSRFSREGFTMTDTTIRLWWATLPDFDGLLESLEERLPSEERRRAARFRVEAARHRFVLARCILRRHIGAALDTDPQTLRFATGDRGKPHLAFPEIENPPHFNLSHSGGVVVLITAAADVGVDVESLREIANAERMARRFFSSGERSRITSLAGAARDHAFLRIWTQKEAYLKATGLGVGMPLNEVETEPDPQAPPRLVAIAGDRVKAERWTLAEATIPGSICTIAVRGSVAELQVLRFTPADL